MTYVEYRNGYFCTYMATLCREGYRNGWKECPRTTLSIGKDEIKDGVKEVNESRSVVKANNNSFVSDKKVIIT